MHKLSTVSVSSRRTMMAAIGIVALTALPAIGQVSIKLLVDGSNAKSVPANSSVELAFNVRIESTRGLSGLQFTVLAPASDAGLFEYAANTSAWVFGSPWSAGELLTSAGALVPPAEDMLLSAKPHIVFFKSSAGDYPATSFPSTVVTIPVRSVGSLPDGVYTFMAGDMGDGFYWTGSDGNGTFSSSGIFTLTVGAGEPPPTGGSAGGGGAATDPDTDGDGIPDSQDQCAGSNDNDDSDTDGVPDGCDNCPNDPNADQADSDSDGFGNVCDQQDDTQDQPDEPVADDGMTDQDSGDGATDDGAGGDGAPADDAVVDDGQDDGNVIAPAPCGAGLVELSVMSLMSLYLVQRSRRRRAV